MTEKHSVAEYLIVGMLGISLGLVLYTTGPDAWKYYNKMLQTPSLEQKVAGHAETAKSRYCL